jgi:hypothetical protein
MQLEKVLLHQVTAVAAGASNGDIQDEVEEEKRMAKARRCFLTPWSRALPSSGKKYVSGCELQLAT